jgi:hypothetical protein
MTTTAPDGPWLNETAAIGPVRKVCPISSSERTNLVCLVFLFILLSPFPLGFFAFAMCATARLSLGEGPTSS